MELALTHWRERMGSNWQPSIGWVRGSDPATQSNSTGLCLQRFYLFNLFDF